MKPLLALTLLIAACSSEAPGPSVDIAALLNKGEVSAADGDWAAALSTFDAVLAAAVSPDDQAAIDAQYIARRGAIQALAASKPLEALLRAVKLLEDEGERVDPDLFGAIAGDFRQAGSLDAAALMTAMGLQRFPGDPGLGNLKERLTKETWQLMETDLGAIGYLRQADSPALSALGLQDLYPGNDRMPFINLLDPLTAKWISDQAYADL